MRGGLNPLSYSLPGRKEGIGGGRLRTVIAPGTLSVRRPDDHAAGTGHEIAFFHEKRYFRTNNI